MTDDDIAGAAYAYFRRCEEAAGLRSRIEDRVCYGAPATERALLKRHPEHLKGKRGSRR